MKLGRKNEMDYFSLIMEFAWNRTGNGVALFLCISDRLQITLCVCFVAVTKVPPHCSLPVLTVSNFKLKFSSWKGLQFLEDVMCN